MVAQISHTLLLLNENGRLLLGERTVYHIQSCLITH